MVSFSSLSGKEIATLIPVVLTSGVVAYLVLSSLYQKARGCSGGSDCVNRVHEKDKAKVVHSFDIEDLPNQVAYCRCWRSNKFPLCDGSHNAHNKLTGDNVGPLLLKRNHPTS